MGRALDWFSPLHPSRLSVIPEDRLTYTGGDTVRLRLEVQNAGPRDVRGIVVHWELPQAVTFDDRTVPAGWTWDGTTRLLSWTGDLARDERLVPVPEVVVTLDGAMGEDVTLTSRAEIVGDGIPVRRHAEWRVNAPDLRESGKSVPEGQRYLSVGERATFAVTVRNTGTRAADDFVVTDTLPSGLALVRTSVFADGGGRMDLDRVPNGIVWRGAVAPGHTTALTYQASVVTYQGGWLRNQAVLDDHRGRSMVLEASVFARPQVLLPWLGREIERDP
jgi:uncharacterized repeat protein (TIGR01451 family)